MGSHSVICHPTQVNTPCHKKPHRPVLDLPTSEEKKAELIRVLVIYLDFYLLADGYPFKY